jgi:hypothetical protein
MGARTRLAAAPTASVLPLLLGGGTAGDDVATHDIDWLSCQKADLRDACSVRFTTK